MGIKDRGLKKFRMVSMQPELISSFKDFYKEQEYTCKPELDEQQLDYLNHAICDSMECTKEVSITYFREHRYELVIGHIHYFNTQTQSIRVVDKFNEWLEIKIVDILDIQ
ncbi:YolD-like family protein [Mesobacillus zeae]|uniref:YolD-like family protein n=1 Tax=Mesobacillus zeae TaxID=1917180 RepID=UPI00300AEC02